MAQRSLVRFGTTIAFLLPFLAACGGGGGGGDGGGGTKCSRIAGQGCEAGFFCNYADLGCGETTLEGTCEPIPIVDCSIPTTPPSGEVCSCAGLTFDNQCWANQGGQSVRSGGACQ